MKAIVQTKYGSPDVLQLQEVDKPIPQDNEVLIKIIATTVSATDTHFRRADPFVIRFMNGLTSPRNDILGSLFAGEIEEVGKNVTLFGKGDQVFGSSDASFGTHAEYIALPEDGVLALKPDGMTYEEAAGLPEALTPLYFLRFGEYSKRTKNPHQWRFRRPWHVCSTAGQTVRGRSYRGMQYQECRNGEISGGRSSH